MKKLSKLKSGSLKFVALPVILLVMVLTVTGCDLAESFRQYGVTVEITNVAETDIERLSIRAGDTTVDDFEYDAEGIVRVDIGDLRGRTELKPVLAENDEQDFYPESVTVEAADDGETINFNAVQETTVYDNDDLGEKIEEAYPGDRLTLDNNYDFNDVTISTPGLTLKSMLEMDETDPRSFSNVAGIEITADDVTIDELNIIAGGSIEIKDSNNVRLVDNRIVGSGSVTGVKIDNSEVSLENNLIRDKSTGIKALAGSEINLYRDEIRDNSESGVSLRDSRADRIKDATIRDNEQGFELKQGSYLKLEDSVVYKNNWRGIFAQDSRLEIQDSEFSRNLEAIEAENSTELALHDSDITNSDNHGLKIEGGDVSISRTDFINNEYALVGRELSSIDLRESTIRNNDYGISLEEVAGGVQLIDNKVNYNSDYGWELQGISGELSHNEIISNRNGISHQNGGSLQVKYNDIEDNRRNGLRVEDAAAIVEFNNIHYNDSAGGSFTGERAVVESRVNNNSIIENRPGLYADVNGLDVELNAEENWWGSGKDIEDIEDMIRGPVRFEPVLESEPDAGS